MAQQITIPMSREKLEEKRKAAAAMGYNLDGDSGEVYYSLFKVGAKYIYDGTNLTITIVKKPWYLFPAAINSAVRGWLV